MFQGLGDPCPDRTRDENTSIFPPGRRPSYHSGGLHTKEPAAHGLASAKLHGLSSGFQNGSSQRRFRKWRLRKAERLARLGAAVGTLLGGLGGSGCPPPQPIPGRAASLPLPANSLDGIPGPRQADRAARTPLSRLVGLRVATATATSGSGCSGLPLSRGPHPAPSDRVSLLLLATATCGSGCCFPPVPLPAPRPCFSVAPGNSHFRERVQFPPVPPPRPSTASARTQGSGLPATVSRRSSLSAGGSG
ncbi:unnamed protein product [Rangifer tarandus platyrhynchus]|uniref:Uncharacterized protein n=1 Tax=Rangifer tarandus platyrhynchus TaxID=3082113 RepID=A0AC59ZFI8_RANTA